MLGEPSCVRVLWAEWRALHAFSPSLRLCGVAGVAAADVLPRGEPPAAQAHHVAAHA